MKLRYIAETGCEPLYGSASAAGIDLRAKEAVAIGSDPIAVKTGLCVEIPPGHVGLVRGRSGLAFKRHLIAFEGTIDEDYRGEISVLLMRGYPVGGWIHVEQGERIAQLVIVPVARLELEQVTELGVTERGSQGFGSTGTM